MNKIREEFKIDMGLKACPLNNTNITGKYHSLAGFRSIIAILSVADMAKTKTAIIQLMQAKNNLAGSAKVITLGVATITACELATELTITLATVLNTESIVITVDGVDYTFTAHTDTTDLTIRQFDISGNDTADALEFLTCVNDPTYGVPGITASQVAGVVTLVSTIPGEKVISAVSSDLPFTVATLSAIAYVEIDPMILDDTFTHIAAKVTVTADTDVSVTFLRGKHVKAIEQAVGAEYDG